MFLDASALCAVLLVEADGDIILAKIGDAAILLTSPLALYETTLAVAREKGGGIAAARADVSQFVAIAKIQVVAIGEAEGALALDAFDRYGKGRHPAKLNMGDCFAYACARTHGVPLLFKGDDFTLTDVVAA